MVKAGKTTMKSSLFENTTPSVDQIVDSFRAKHPEYRRYNLQSFTRMVKQTLDSNNINYDDDDDEGEITSTSSRKSAKRYDNREQSSESESKYSTAADDVQMEAEIDITKSMLRNKYYSGSKLDGKPDQETDGGVKAVEKVEGNNGGGSKIMFKDFGGMDDVLNELIKQVIIPLYHHEVCRDIGIRPTTGILLHGPPGCGKTSLATAIANETGWKFHETSGPKLVSGISGESEKNIRELFSKAHRTAPSIVFIDEIDAIDSKRENHDKGMESRIVAQLMTCMNQPFADQQDNTNSKDPETSDNKPGHVLVIGATNRPDALDPAIRRPGRFDREIALGVPNEKARFQILKARTRGMKFEGDVDLVKISRATPGFVGADLERLVNVAGITALVRVMDVRELEFFDGTDQEIYKKWWEKPFSVEERRKVRIRMSDFEVAINKTQASLKREGFNDIPDVKWEDVGGLETLRKELYSHIIWPIKFPEEYKNPVNMATGFLLYGPPGCGKTLIAKAVANEAGANFIHIKGPDLLNKYVGESELAVRKLFSRARTCSPCIVFFDEVDALTNKNGREGVEGVWKQLLLELDGGEERKGVYVIGATNRPEVIDEALLRPGRFGRQLYVCLPNPDQRGLILKALGKNSKYPVDADVDLIAIGVSEACANFSGADLKALLFQANMAVDEERHDKMEAAKAKGEPESSLVGLPHIIQATHFQQALGKIRPSVSKKQIQRYDRVSNRFTAL